jgi:hypothetical protein
MTTVPVPHLVLILPVMGTTFGRPLLSASFSRQDFFALVLMSKSEVKVSRYFFAPKQ